MSNKLVKLLLSLSLTLGLTMPAFAEDLVINGSTTVLPVMQKVIENYKNINPSLNISLAGGGSGNGIKALIDSLANVAMSSRQIKDSEVEQAKKNNINPIEIPVAIDALIPVVNLANPIQNITSEQLRDIYNGKVKNWKELGGNDEKIVVISRDSSSGTFETWAELVMNKEKVAPTALASTSNGAVVQTIASNKLAIGYIGIGYLDASLKALSVNGIAPSSKSAIDGQWPIARELYLYTNGQASGELAGLIEYILDENKGQKAVAEVGFIPLAK